MTPAPLQADLCVVGAGLAGLSAAVRAAQLGSRVLVLEQSADTTYLCNSRMANGMFHLALHSVLSGEDVLVQAVNRATRHTADPALVRALAADAPRGVRWLQSLGVRFFRASFEPHHNFTLSPPATHRQGPYDVRWRAGDVMLRRLEAHLLRHGGRILRGHRASGLRMTQGQCTGVQGTAGPDPFHIEATAVVLADGGFQANPRLLAQYGISPQPERLVQRNARSARGDGLQMAVAAGAQLADMLGFYGHLQCRDAIANDRLWPYPWLDLVAAAGIVVGPDGRRFVDEGRGGVYMANRVAALPDPLSAHVIFDAAIWQTAGRTYLKAPNPRLVASGGTLVEAPSLAALAERLGLPADALEREVAAHNQVLAQGGGSELQPPRTPSSARPAQPIVQPPFHAVPLAAGITHTMGGVAIDASSRVLARTGTVIGGLYAAGSCTGGIEGGEHAGYVGGLVKALVTGLHAAEHSAGTRWRR